MTSHKKLTEKQDHSKKGRHRKGGLAKWLFRLLFLVLLLLGILVSAVLNPGLFYKHKTTIGTFTIYHADTMDAAFQLRLQEAVKLISGSEVYNPSFSMDICLGESAYPTLIKHLFGNAFAWGFYNKVVISGTMDFKKNVHQSNWNLSQLLAHEMTHCLQFDKLGLFHSNPLAGHPEWKWEGYPEYVARQGITEPLVQSVARLVKAQQDGNTGSIALPDGTETNPGYYKHWLLVKFWLQTRKKAYTHLLNDTITENGLREEMMRWYKEKL